MTPPIPCRLIADPPKPGILNMAVDDALLQDAAENGTATLRFYIWDEPTLSLGYLQRYVDRQQHASSHDCAIVRRQTGGGAILHDRELTYSLTLPPTHKLANHNEQLYYAVHHEFIAALSLTAAGEPNWNLHTRDQCGECPPDGEPFLCFLRQSPGDVILTPAGKTVGTQPATSANLQRLPVKILGSAQRRYRGAILQHGSLILERSPAAPELPGFCDLVGLTVSADNLSRAVKTGLANALGLDLCPADVPPELESKAAELANNKYGTSAWTKRR